MQLQARLELLSVTPLDDTSLAELAQYQSEQALDQGVYLLHYAGQPVYLGKANDVWERLTQHRQKLKGRELIDQTVIGYKALLLDKSMSTAANEGVLIGLFKKTHSGMWNGRGFGPKDPGQERDTTKPSWFDRTYPIIRTYPIPGLADAETVGQVVDSMKATLPYVFRSEISEADRAEVVQLRGVPRDALSMLQALVNALGSGWQGTIISYGMLLYKNDKHYPHGTVLVASAPS